MSGAASQQQALGVPSDHVLGFSRGKRGDMGTCVAAKTTWALFRARLLAEPQRSAETMAEFHALPKAERAARKQADWFVGAPSIDGKRLTESFPVRTLLTLDVDEADPSFLADLQHGAGALSALEYAGHTTRSSTPEQPRLRLVLPLAEPLPAEQHALVVEGLAALIEVQHAGVVVDRCSTDAARLLYAPSLCADAPHVAFANAGTFPDVDALAARGRAALEAKEAAERQARVEQAASQKHRKATRNEDDAATIKAGWREVLAAMGGSVELSRHRRTEWTTICPWHDDHDPSLDITDDGLMICRTCKRGGTVIDYVMQARDCDIAAAFALAREALGMPPRAHSNDPGATTDGDVKQGAGADKDDGERHSQADVLTAIGMTCERFLHDGRVYADLVVNGHRETVRVTGTAFRKWLSGEYFRQHRKAARGEAVAQALAAIEAATEYGEQTPKRAPVCLRSCLLGDRIVIDLGSEDWSAIVVTAEGWEVVKEPPVRFRRTEAMLPLPKPARGGNIDGLREWLNAANEESFVLTIAWMLYGLRGDAPFAILPLYGEHGSGKTTYARIVKAFTDPARAAVRACPTNPQDFWVGAARQRVIAYDNISSIPTWLSDALCQVSSGGGFSARQLYSNDEESILDASCAVILNGIEDFVTRADLADRCAPVTLAFIPEEKRIPDKVLWAAVAEAAPGIFGALLDGLVEGLRRRDSVKLDRLPRMADFALWGAACETAYWSEGTFTRAYAANRDATSASVLDSDLVAGVLQEWLVGKALPWSGTPKEILAALDAHAATAPCAPTKDKAWPHNGRRMAGLLRRAAPALRQVGFDVVVEHDKQRRRTTVEIRAVSRPDMTANAATDREAAGDKCGFAASAVCAASSGDFTASLNGDPCPSEVPPRDLGAEAMRGFLEDEPSVFDPMPGPPTDDDDSERF